MPGSGSLYNRLKDALPEGYVLNRVLGTGTFYVHRAGDATEIAKIAEITVKKWRNPGWVIRHKIKRWERDSGIESDWRVRE